MSADTDADGEADHGVDASQPVLLVGSNTNAGDVLEVLDHLQERYDVSLEHEGEHQVVYAIDGASGRRGDR